MSVEVGLEDGHTDTTTPAYAQTTGSQKADA
jgi:hypothetical protein